MIGTCHLCLEKKELLKKSHVIPDFFYRESKLYDKNHTLLSIDLLEFLKTNRLKAISVNQKSGDYEKFILCAKCDGEIISSYESYTRDFLYADILPKNRNIMVKCAKDHFEFSNVNYKLLKLMLLSMLWRADCSKRLLFNMIDVGSKREELRQMIYNGNPKTDKDFPIFFMHTLFDENFDTESLFHPVRFKSGNDDNFIFCFSGLIILISLGFENIPVELQSDRLHENGTFRIQHIPPGETWKLLKSLYIN